MRHSKEKPRQTNFYPRSPCGERQNFFKIDSVDRDFYPRSPCGERLSDKVPLAESTAISIHALLAESDGIHYDNYNLHCVISIHALLAESDANQTNLPG